MGSSLDIFHALINYSLSVTIFSSFSSRFVFRDILSEEEHPLVVVSVEISSAWLPDKGILDNNIIQYYYISQNRTQLIKTMWTGLAETKNDGSFSKNISLTHIKTISEFCNSVPDLLQPCSHCLLILSTEF